jgi:hypothetical protein
MGIPGLDPKSRKQLRRVAHSCLEEAMETIIVVRSALGDLVNLAS